MKSVLSFSGLLGVLLAASLPAVAQSSLNFPRQFQPSEMSSTGFAVANPSLAEATVVFTLYSDSGVALATTTRSVPAGGQYAKLGSELFSNPSLGWVQATSTTPGLTGFWLSGDFDSYTDGAEAAGVGTAMILPLVTDQTEISIANASDATNSVHIRLLASDGTDVIAPVTHSIAKLGVYQAKASAIFPGAVFAQAKYVLLDADAAIAATSLVRGFLVSTETAVLNAVESSSASSTLHFAHVVSGPIGGAAYSTVIGVTNVTSAALTVELSFYSEPTGSVITVQRNLPGLGALRESAESIFRLPSGFSDGWVKVVSPSAITGFVAYAETVSGGLAVVPPQPAARGSLLFAHVAGAPVWYTGIALLNASGVDANVEVSVLDPAGSLIGSVAKFDILAKHKTAKLLGQLVPEANSQNGGFIIVHTNVPLFGLQLFGSATGRVLSNIASGKPGPSDPSTVLNPSLLNTSVGRISLESVEWDYTNPHGCSPPSNRCFNAAAGNRALRLKFNLFDRQASTIGSSDALSVFGFVTVDGSNFAATTPFLLGAVQPPPIALDTWITFTGGVLRGFNNPAAPPYNTVYVGFEIPANAEGVKLNWPGNPPLDLGQ